VEQVSVLIVDDEPDVLVILHDLLRLHLVTPRVDTASSGTVALALIKSHDYDVVISDVLIPDMDGFTLTGKIGALRPNTPTVLVTAHGDRDIGVRAMNSGAYAFVTKPIDREYLMAWVARAIHMRRLGRNLESQRDDLKRQTEMLQRANLALHEAIEKHRCHEGLLEKSIQQERLHPLYDTIQPRKEH
jgi:two-component system, sensor histidine kinase and response regulator